MPWWLLSLGLLALGGASLWLLPTLRSQPVAPASAPRPPLVETATLQPRSGSLTVVGYGFVRPAQQTQLAPQVNGQVATLDEQLTAGGRFRRGQVLIRLDPRPYRIALTRAEAELKAARAARTLRQQQRDRLAPLVSQNAASQDALDEQESLLRQADAEIERLEAQRQQAQLDLEYTALKAPFDGWVLSKQVALGDVVQPNESLAVLVAAEAAEVHVSLGADQAALLDLWRQGGTPPAAEVTIDYGGRRFRWPGEVAQAELALESSSRTVGVVVTVPNPFRSGELVAAAEAAVPALFAPPLLVNSYARVAIAAPPLERYWVAPQSALDERDQLWLVTPEQTLIPLATRPLQRVEEQVYFRLAANAPAPISLEVMVSALPIRTEGMRVRAAADRTEAEPLRLSVQSGER